MHTDLSTRPHPLINALTVATVVRFLDRTRLVSIGVNGLDGWPQVTTMGYVNEGLDLYFVTGRESQQLSNLQADSRISLAIHSDGVGEGLVGLVMSGHAHEVSNPDEIQSLNTGISERWPDFSVYCPASRSVAVVCFRPEVIGLISAVGGHSTNAYFSVSDQADNSVAEGCRSRTDSALQEPASLPQQVARHDMNPYGAPLLAPPRETRHRDPPCPNVRSAT